MNLQHFKSFIITAEHTSITSAARAMYISPVSLMQQLNLFEEELGFKVFHRSRKGITLTPAGQILLKKGKPLFHDLDDLIRECRASAEQEQQRIRISLARPYYLMDVSKAYAAAHPQVHLEFDRIDPLTHANLHMHFTESGYDLIQLVYDPEQPYSFCHILPFPEDQLCCVCSREHPFSNRSFVHLEELGSQRLQSASIFPGLLAGLNRELAARALSLPIQRSFFSEQNVIRCCANNGVYLLQKQVAVSFSFLSVVPITPTIPCYPGIAYSKNAEAAVLHFVHYIREHMDVIAAQYE